MTVTVDDLAAVLCRKIRDEDDHSHFNGHRLDRDCQGVGPGEHVPAIRTTGLPYADHPDFRDEWRP